MMCRYDREQLALYVNGDATTEERQVTQEHLSQCTECHEIVVQYQSTAAEVAGTIMDSRPTRSFRHQSANRLWRSVAGVAAIVMAMLVVTQVPAIAAKVGKVFPWMAVFELDGNGVAEFIRGFSQTKVGKVYSPDQYQTVEEAEQAWGGKIPQPNALPGGMELYRIDMFRWESGHKDVHFRYQNHQTGGNLTVHLSTRSQQRKVPSGATSEIAVNGQKAMVIKGTWGQYSGKPLQWEPDSDIHLFFPLGDLFVEVSTAGQQPGITVSDLVKVAESIR